MKYIPYIYIGAFTFLIACSSEERITTTDSNEEPSGPIELSAGIAEGNSKATTRTGAEDHHTTPGHHTFTAGTKLALRVSGTWTGHTPSGEIVETTTASLNGVAPDTNDKHNKLSCSPVLYWEDYGTSDINNMGTGKGREEGLTIYGAAVDGLTSVPSGLIGSGSTIDGTIGKWTSLGWTLDANQSSGFSEKDLLISNNISGDNGTTYETDYGRYLFDHHTLGKLLEFKHALSKITVVLTAGDGFVDKNGDTLLDFANDPEVKLTSNDASTSNPEWACTKGNVNITSGGVTLTGTSPSGDPAVITMWQASSTGHVVTKEALVMPGSHFIADDAIIARINADGNIYYVTAQNIRAKMYTLDSSTNYLTEAGKNYIINVTVNKTDIVVTATVANWTEVEADPVAPKVNVTGDLGNIGSNLPDDSYSFYFSKFENQYSINNGYGTQTEAGDIDFYAEQRSITKSGTTWTMSTPLYWPDHNTHYQFRCIWPRTTTNSGTVTKVAPAVSDSILSNPRVELFKYGTQDYHIIRVQNVAYSAGTFPSDLMIARPEINDPNITYCSNTETGHTSTLLYSGGICATQGTINLNFQYMMSQVEVNLKTNDGQADEVNLTNAKVELVDVHKTGLVKLGDRGIFLNGVRSATPAPATDTFGDYPLGNYALTITDGKKNVNYRSAIVPQSVANAKFRITIYKNGDTNSIDDIYYADIAPLTSGSAWTSGYRYVYTLTVTKTKIDATATLTNWTTVNADHTVWF